MSCWRCVQGSLQPAAVPLQIRQRLKNPGDSSKRKLPAKIPCCQTSPPIKGHVPRSECSCLKEKKKKTKQKEGQKETFRLTLINYSFEIVANAVSDRRKRRKERRELFWKTVETKTNLKLPLILAPSQIMTRMRYSRADHPQQYRESSRPRLWIEYCHRCSLICKNTRPTWHNRTRCFISLSPW